MNGAGGLRCRACGRAVRLAAVLGRAEPSWEAAGGRWIVDQPPGCDRLLTECGLTRLELEQALGPVPSEVCS